MNTIQPATFAAPAFKPGPPAPSPQTAAPTDQVHTSGESDASQPHQDKAAASIVANLPRPCSDGCACSACGGSSSDPAGALKARDSAVERHEQAHAAAAGSDATSAPSYELQTGPDGKSYRIGGHVNVSLKEDDANPEQTVQRMERVQRSALAPADPSGQDQKVASEASQKLSQARAKLSKAGHNSGSGLQVRPGAGSAVRQ